MSDPAQKIISNIERKDNGLRIAMLSFMLAIILGLLWVVYIQHKTLRSVEAQLANQQAIVEEIRQTAEAQDHVREEQLNRVNRHMDCIVLFFQQPDRADKFIDDVNACTLQETQVPPYRGSSRSTAPQSSVVKPPTQTTPPETTPRDTTSAPQPETPTTPEPQQPPAQEKPSLIETLTNPVRELIELII